jgi:hypothetical protein
MSLLPHHLDVATIQGIREVVDQLDKEATSFYVPMLEPLLVRLLDPATHIGELGPFLLALALGAKPARYRSLAIDALLTCVHDGRADAGQVGTLAARAVADEVTKLTRVADALDEIARIDPTIARTVTSAMLPQLLDHRDAHKLLMVLAEAIAASGPIDLPPDLLELAKSGGKRRVDVEARRVAKLCS